MNEQRKVIYQRRDQILEGDDLKSAAMEYLAEAVDALIETHCASAADDEWDLDGLAKELKTFWPTAITEEQLADCRNTDEIVRPRDGRRHRALRAARGRARRRGDARGRAPGDAAHHRPALARAPRGDGLPQGGHQPAGDGPEGPAHRVAARGLRDVRRDDEGHRPGLRALRDARPGRPEGSADAGSRRCRTCRQTSSRRRTRRARLRPRAAAGGRGRGRARRRRPPRPRAGAGHASSRPSSRTTGRRRRATRRARAGRARSSSMCHGAA